MEISEAIDREVKAQWRHDLERRNLRGCVLFATPCRGDAKGTNCGAKMDGGNGGQEG